MAAPKEERNRSEKEPASNNGGASRRSSVPGVDFGEMNFEQRRAPYNSGKRNVGKREYDETRNDHGSNSERKQC